MHILPVSERLLLKNFHGFCFAGGVCTISRLFLAEDNQCTEGSQVPWGRLTMFHTPLMYTRLCSVFLQTTLYTYKCHLQYSSLLFLEYMIKWTQVLHLEHRESGEAVWEEGLRCYPVEPHLLLNKIPPHFSLLCAVFFIHVLIVLRDGQVCFHHCLFV